MKQAGSALLFSLILLIVGAGCADQGIYVPEKWQITDVESSKTFTTYDIMAKENMLGLNFWDIDSQTEVMLKSYQKTVLSKGGYFPKTSPEYAEYHSDVESARQANPSDTKDDDDQGFWHWFWTH